MTPAEITKLTEQASRAKALMVRSSSTGERAKTVFDNYEKTLGAFESNVERVSKEDAALAAMMAGIGNAGPVLDAAFQDDAATNSAPLTAAAAPADVAQQRIPVADGDWPGVHWGGVRGDAAPQPPAAQEPFREPGAGNSATGSGT